MKMKEVLLQAEAQVTNNLTGRYLLTLNLNKMAGKQESQQGKGSQGGRQQGKESERGSSGKGGKK